MALLAVEGFAVTQTTISRDLNELGVRKVGEAYEVPEESSSDSRERRKMLSSLRNRIISLHRGGTLVIIRTGPGYGPAVAAEIAAAGLPHLLGVVAGVDSVFLATETATQSRMLLKLIESA